MEARRRGIDSESNFSILNSKDSNLYYVQLINLTISDLKFASLG